MRMLAKILSITLVLVLGVGCAYAQEGEYANPLINPKAITEYKTLQQKMINILLLGIDYGHEGYWGSGGKKTLEDCHTDAVMVIAVNLDENTMDFVSLPRDTLTYIPGVKGIYKLNAAINCGNGSLEDGLQKACRAAEWVLGGIKIDYYCAVDMNAMAALGDAMGGVDFELEMSYKGHSGTKYRKGLRHLNGTGIMDYLRARKNATVNSNDIGRTGRQRELILAIFKKLKEDQESLVKVLKKAKELQGSFFTDITAADALSLLAIASNLEASGFGSYVITGEYKTALKGWNFTFTNQENRHTVIKKVYGVDVPPLSYVDFAYTKWLMKSGFLTIHYLGVADQLREYIEHYAGNNLTEAQREAVTAFEDAYQETMQAFEAAAISVGKSDTKTMDQARKLLRTSGTKAAELCEYSQKLPWSTGKYWYADRYINEIGLIWQ